MRVGQKNDLVYQWAVKGTRPRQPRDQRYENAYLFGAFCAERNVGAALILPAADTEAMQLHLEEIGRSITPGAHGLVVLDKAGWHTTKALKPPSNVTLLPLPPASPELNPAENPYLQWILKGRHTTALPFALREENFQSIRNNLHRLEWIKRGAKNTAGGCPNQRRLAALCSGTPAGGGLENFEALPYPLRVDHRTDRAFGATEDSHQAMKTNSLRAIPCPFVIARAIIRHLTPVLDHAIFAL